ncbi:MAG: hypothetical protein HY906_02155 [Deltaproteobacteria bacterium]|nr:hypothetical protein [Deltaproteobacteria bacterium]
MEIASPASGARLSSPLGIVSVRWANAVTGVATLTVGRVRHILRLEAPAGELRENVTLLEGSNTVAVEVDGARCEITVEVERSHGIAITAPAPVGPERAADFAGAYEGASCPAGVVSVNGFMQQFAVPESRGSFAEKVVLGAGFNHLAVQIGELYATLLVEATFAPAKLVVTLVWDTPATDLDLYVVEPSGGPGYVEHQPVEHPRQNRGR